FLHVAPATGGGAPLDGVTGTPLFVPRVLGAVNAVVPDGAGGWYLGGSFTSVGGVARSNLARILSANTVAAWDPGANRPVYAPAVQSGVVYAGGDFSAAGGQARHRIAAVGGPTAPAAP